MASSKAPVTPARGIKLTLGPPVSGENLFGREREIDDLWSSLTKGHVLLVAPRRVGKTSLMWHLRDQSREDFTALYIDVESAPSPDEFVAALAEALRKHTRLQGYLEKFPALDSLLRRTKLSVSAVVKMDVAGESWRDVGREVLQRLRKHPGRLLIILDEFPLFIRHIARPDRLGPTGAEEFLNWFRGLRIDPELAPKVRFLLGGSIGLAGVLARLRLSATVNDVRPLELGPFDRTTAMEFLWALEAGEDLQLLQAERESLLDELRYFMPFHIQLVFAEIKSLSRAAVPPPDRVRAAIANLLRAQSSQLKHMVERLSDAFAEQPELELAQKVLTLACKDADGIPAVELRAAVAAPASDRPSALLNEVLDTLCHDGYLDQEPGPDDTPGRYLFRSTLLRRYWKRKQLG